ARFVQPQKKNAKQKKRNKQTYQNEASSTHHVVERVNATQVVDGVRCEQVAEWCRPVVHDAVQPKRKEEKKKRVSVKTNTREQKQYDKNVIAQQASGAKEIFLSLSRLL